VKLLAELRRITPYAPEHLPREIELIEAFRKRYPRLPQVACFDTAFHRTMPPVAKLLTIPRRYQKQGIERYGFHGLSCTHLIEELKRLAPAAAEGRVILAHLGNGSSVTAVKNGESVETSMAFTPAAGLIMSTRTGDLDPGLLYFLSHSERMTPARFHRRVNHESGLLGVSGLSSDMRDLLRRESSNRHAAEAVALYCYQAKKWIGSLAAVLGGVDALVFTGGIGENSQVIRDRICEGLEFLDINSKVWVIPADEERVIARAVRDIQ
jgi:acetate kinase